MQRGSGSNSHFFNELRVALNRDRQNNIEYLYDHTVQGDRRWKNLVSYLEFMQAEDPDILMIGEAPGYRGTSVSGVPFLSEQMIELRQKQGLKLPISNYVPSGKDGAPSYEATSTAMWSVLDQQATVRLPLLWATLPNHPHNPETILSNRKPSKQEVQSYIKTIELLANEYAVKQIVAIGNVAYDTLISNGYDGMVKLRHPARGGVRKFADGYACLIEEFYGKR